jgi:hypothetical protein
MANKVPSMSGSGMSSLYMKYLAPHYALRRFHGDRAQLLPSGLFTGTPMGFFTETPWFFPEKQLIATLRRSRSADALVLRIRAERSRARRGRAPGLNKAVSESRLPHQDSHPSLPQQHHRQIGESALSPAKFHSSTSVYGTSVKYGTSVRTYYSLLYWPFRAARKCLFPSTPARRILRLRRRRQGKRKGEESCILLCEELG